MSLLQLETCVLPSRGDPQMKAIKLFLTPEMIKALDKLVEQGVYGSRAAAIRVAIRDLLIFHKVWKKR